MISSKMYINLKLKSKGYKLDVDNLVLVPVKWTKWCSRNDVVKKDICNAKTKNIEDSIPDITIDIWYWT